MSRPKFYVVVKSYKYYPHLIIDSVYETIELARSRMFQLRKTETEYNSYVQEYLSNQPNGKI